jgi:hypothetical protein
VAGLELLTWAAFAGQCADAFVTARAGGVSAGPYESLNLGLSVGDDPAAVADNRRRLAAAIGADLGGFVFTRQVHGAGVRVVTAADAGTGALALDESVPEGDVLVTADPSVVLAILTADCVPIVLLDSAAGVLACVHAGWRGTVARACAAAVDAMTGLGAVPARVIAGIGPAIAADRYQVGAEVAGAARDAFGPDAVGGGVIGGGVIDGGAVDAGAVDGGAEAILRPDGTGRWLFGLPAANRLVLRESGLRDENIHVTQYVTGTGVFFSDRSARPCGRLALVARLRTRPQGSSTSGSSFVRPNSGGISR